jgi:hypothetical protein
MTTTNTIHHQGAYNAASRAQNSTPETTSPAKTPHHNTNAWDNVHYGPAQEVNWTGKKEVRSGRRRCQVGRKQKYVNPLCISLHY